MHPRAGGPAFNRYAAKMTFAPLPAPAAAAIRVDRACSELRRGRPLALFSAPTAAESDGEPGWLVAAVETLGEDRLRHFAGPDAAPRLLLTAERLQALGWAAASTPRALALGGPPALASLQRLAAVTAGEIGPELPGDGEPADATLLAALALCKRARLLPALLVRPLPAQSAAALAAAEVLQISAADLAQVAPVRPGALRRVSDARVPLLAREDSQLVLFREVDGAAEHVAIVFGQPAADGPVPVRLHSSCLTGDLLGSLRCDCGPQLQRAVEQLGQTGGVLLYLSQEGRGTGLANKLRAYRLQDGGLDTLQADRHLGFRADERDFQAAAAMLRELGIGRIRLLTNNPNKIEALRRHGIEVVDRLALHGPVNPHNARYVQTKQAAGHLADGD
jgi:GTP cyclohydrolase II